MNHAKMVRLDPWQIKCWIMKPEKKNYIKGSNIYIYKENVGEKKLKKRVTKFFCLKG
jgi:hypothetical protein